MTRGAPGLTFSSPAATAVCVRTGFSVSSLANTRSMRSLDRHCRWTATRTPRRSRQVDLPVLVAHQIWDMILMAVATPALHGSI